VKVDTETGATIYREFAPNLTGEPLFVPRPGGTDEDDGWIVTNVFVESTGRSVLYVLDARAMEPICIARLPHHVPPGFHGTFLGA
jgi:carotenoid cleavage dioxygenase-like enzyme